MDIRENIKHIDKYKLFIFICFFIGIFLRILFFSYNRPLWLDECSLALNIKNTWNFFAPLQYNQSAPQLFMYLSKLIYMCPPPDKELLLRIIPLISSILSIGLFYFLTDKFCVKKITKITALILFSTCYRLCYYAQEFKQYSSDVFCFLLILASYFYLKTILNDKKKLFIYGILCSILMWFSFSSIFAIFGVFGTFILFYREQLQKVETAIAPVAVNTVFFYITNRFTSGSNGSLICYWYDYFISTYLFNLKKIFLHNINYFFNNSSIIGPIWIISFFISIFKEKRNETFYLLILPFLMECVLSYLKIYPFSSRLVLFLAPVFILICVKILDFIDFKTKFCQLILYGLIISVLTIPILVNTYKNIILKNYYREDMPKLLKEINNSDSKNDDIIYISYGSQIPYNYYKYTLKKDLKVIYGKNYDHIETYIDDLNNLERNKTYYWICSHNLQKSLNLGYVTEQWSKQQKKFKIYQDKNFNTLIIFTK